MKENKTKPDIRFKGFTDDWEQRKLIKEIDSIDTGKSKFNIVDHGRYAILGSTGVIGYDNYYDYEGDFLLTARVGANAGTLYKYTGKVKITDNTVFFQGNNIDFIYYLLNKFDLKKLSFGSGQPLIKSSELKNLKLLMPLLIEEKEKIAVFFNSIDDLITLHQRECNQLKELKKTMLKKMFPRDGSNIPEVRFAGFTDDWEQRKLEKFIINVAKKNKENLNLEPYAVTNDRGFIKQKEAHNDFGYMNNVDRTAYNIVPPNSFAYNPARINVGSLGYYTGVENVIVSSLYEVFQTNDYLNDRFLWHWLKSDFFPVWIERLQEGSVRLYFYFDKLIQCKLMMPSLEEQIQIGIYLDSLDNLITLHQRELEILKNLKKTCLKRMFI